MVVTLYLAIRAALPLCIPSRRDRSCIAGRGFVEWGAVRSPGEIQRGGSADPPLGRFKEGIVKGNPIERGSDASTACGRLSELSEWQRSASSKQSEAAAGYRNRTPLNCAFGYFCHKTKVTKKMICLYPLLAAPSETGQGIDHLHGYRLLFLCCELNEPQLHGQDNLSSAVVVMTNEVHPVDCVMKDWELYFIFC